MERGKLLKIQTKANQDWYEGLSADQPDGVTLDAISRDKFNQAFESYLARSYDNAYKGFAALSKRGSCISQYFLGLMYLHGMGVLQDFCRAHMWLNIASSQGHNKARIHLEKLTKKMNADQVAKSQQLARKWVAKIY